ncbi:MAG: MBL fold metallo-hydrolase [Bacteroidales bacterium]|nr:MBL fold metallo-hydrolase [Candidatus Physcousia equi]
MKITFLGTGTSTGVPQIGCQCPVCQSKDPRDRRLRCSTLFETDHTTLLIDCSPDFREQMLRINLKKNIDACLITHEHYDHVGGIDDLRPFSFPSEVTLYANPYTAKHLRERLPYCLVRHSYPGVPRLVMKEIEPHEQFLVGDIPITALEVMHGELPILAYRIGHIGYITDMKTIEDKELPLLYGIRLLIVNGLRLGTHPTHQGIQEAVDFTRRLEALSGTSIEETYLIHMSHHAGLHAETDALLPDGFHLAYDGLTLTV